MRELHDGAKKINTNTMIVFGIDIGDARIGIAWGDTFTGVASPLDVLPSNAVINNSRSFSALIEEYYPEKLIFGLPKSLDGQSGSQAKKIKEIAKQIASNSNIPYEFIDERLSSQEAKRLLRGQGLSEKQMRGRVDSVAASLFLETWIKSQDY